MESHVSPCGPLVCADAGTAMTAQTANPAKSGRRFKDKFVIFLPANTPPRFLARQSLSGDADSGANWPGNLPFQRVPAPCPPDPFTQTRPDLCQATVQTGI